MNIRFTLLALFLLIAQVLAACSPASIFAAPTPTVQPTPTKDPLSATKVVQAFWDALESGDLETAMVYVDDDITCSGVCHFKGKLIFQSYVQGYLDGGYVTKISDLKGIGNVVTYSWEVYRNGLFVRSGEGDEMMEVEDGKIVYWENYHSSH